MPKDLFLLVIIVVVVAVDILIIFIGAVVPTSHLRAIRIEDLQHPVSFVSPVGVDVCAWYLSYACLSCYGKTLVG